jgi:hypothetical protein
MKERESISLQETFQRHQNTTISIPAADEDDNRKWERGREDKSGLKRRLSTAILCAVNKLVTLL